MKTTWRNDLRRLLLNLTCRFVVKFCLNIHTLAFVEHRQCSPPPPSLDVSDIYYIISVHCLQSHTCTTFEYPANLEELSQSMNECSFTNCTPSARGSRCTARRGGATDRWNSEWNRCHYAKFSAARRPIEGWLIPQSGRDYWQHRHLRTGCAGCAGWLAGW